MGICLNIKSVLFPENSDLEEVVFQRVNHENDLVKLGGNDVDAVLSYAFASHEQNGVVANVLLFVDLLFVYLAGWHHRADLEN